MTAAERATARAEHGAPGATSARPEDPRPKEWPEPRPLTARALAPVPPFDFDLLPEDLRWFVEDVAERMQVAPDMVAVAAMCAVAIVAANARTIHPKRYDSWREFAMLWGVAIAPAGSMKSPAIAPIEKLLTKVEIREREGFEARQYERQAEEMVAQARAKARKKRIEDALGKEGAIDVAELAAELRAQEERTRGENPRRLKAMDTTTEKLAMLVENGKRRCRPMIVWCDELAALLNSFERDGREGDRAFYLTGWSAANHTVDRVGRGSLFLPHLAISVFGAMTPGPFERYVREATGGANADGFLQRLQLMVYPDQPKGWRRVDRAPDHSAEGRALALLERLFAIDEDDPVTGCPRALHFAPDAQEAFDRWLEALELRLRDHANGLSEARRSHLSKYRHLMPALALVCHLASGPGSEDRPVSLKATERAAAWCTYLDAHAERVYSMAQGTSDIEAEIVRRIRAGKFAGAIKVRAIARSLGERSADVEAACEVLEDHGWLVLEEFKRAAGGRPSLVAHINPKGAARAAEATAEGAAA